jgi:hypothetical protein
VSTLINPGGTINPLGNVVTLGAPLTGQSKLEENYTA